MTADLELECREYREWTVEGNHAHIWNYRGDAGGIKGAWRRGYSPWRHSVLTKNISYIDF
jgi:hypothetical protein